LPGGKYYHDILCFQAYIILKLWFAVEVKLNEIDSSPASRYFGNRLKITYLCQACKKENIDLIRDNICILSADRLLAALI